MRGPAYASRRPAAKRPAELQCDGRTSYKAFYSTSRKAQICKRDGLLIVGENTGARGLARTARLRRCTADGERMTQRKMSKTPKRIAQRSEDG
jgi:hypothetical protein